MVNVPKRRGSCPRVWTPMESGDGLLVRIHTATHWFEAALIERLVALALRHGNGLIEITRRANLQLRGVRPEALSALQQELVTLGLAPASAWGERRFVLHTTPWLGLDPACAALGPVLRQLEDWLDDPARSCALHPKLAIALSGPRNELAGLGADLSIALDPIRPAHARISIAIAPHQQHPLGTCALTQVGDWVGAWIQRLAEAPSGDAETWQAQRMHEWVARHGRAALEPHLPSSLEPSLARTSFERSVSEPEGPSSWLGFHHAATPWFGAMLPFGAGDPDQWRALAALCARFGRGTLRSHPGRGLLLRGVDAASRDALGEELARLGLIVHPDDPLTRTVACAGAPACSSAHGETRTLARELSQLATTRLTRGAILHVAGCEKSCAHSGPAAITLVHTSTGPRLGFDCDTARAAQAPVHSPSELRAALSASALKCATPAPDEAVEPDPDDPAP
jgi:precorrin-3B synthase